MFAARIGKLSFFRKKIMVFLLGLLSVLALPPIEFWPVLFLTIPAWLVALEGAQTIRQRFVIGWWFGFGYFLAGVYWVSFSMLTNPDAFAWAIPFSAVLLPAILALSIGIVALLAGVGSPKGWRLLLATAIAWTAIELARYVLDWAAFPWNPLGSVWSAHLVSLQAASLMGVHGLSFLTILIAGVPYLYICQCPKRNKTSLVILILFTVVMAYGVAQLLQPVSSDDRLQVRLIQPNTPLYFGWDPEARIASLQQLVAMSQKDLPADTKLIVWPESAIPFSLEQEPVLRARIAKAIPKDGYLLAGGTRYQGSYETGDFQVWNTVYALDHTGKILGIYDKVHLVPYGEFIPWRSVFPWLQKMTAGAVDFTAGEGPVTLSLPSLPPISPTICYESIFSGAQRNRDAAMLVNVTNDAWFNVSSGPYQHAAAARMRAVEEGIPILRAANSGISFAADARGRVIQSSGIFTTAVLDIELPISAHHTPYSIAGKLTLIILLSVLIMLLLLSSRYNRIKETAASYVNPR